MMASNYIGVKVFASYIKDKPKKDIKRPAGAANIYTSQKFPSSRRIIEMQLTLKDNEVFLIFNPDDTLGFIGR